MAGRLRSQPEWFDDATETPNERGALLAFGAWVHAARSAMACSQAELGALVGLHQSTISRIEHGKLRHLVFATAVRLLLVILEAFGFPRPAGVPPMPVMSARWW
jgi:hypothetical protein